MSEGFVVVRGETRVTLTAAAACYRVEITVVREAYDLGLLGAGEPVGADLAIATEALDRLAQIVRLHRYHELDVGAIAALLADLP